MFTLIIEDKYGAIVDEYSFEDGEFAIGRSQSCDIVLAADNVSRRHARLFTVEGRCYIEDLKAANGIWLNGKRIFNVTELPRSAQVRIGDFFLHIEGAAFARPMGNSTFAHLIPVHGGIAEPFELNRPTTLIGRGKDCTAVVNDASVSRIHAKITRDPSGRVMLEDLRSSNGVFVNERRVDVQDLQHGDRVRFGTVGFVYQVDGEEYRPAPEPIAAAVDYGHVPVSTPGFRAAPPISSYGADYPAYYEGGEAPGYPPRPRSMLPQVAAVAVIVLAAMGLVVLVGFAYDRWVAPAIAQRHEAAINEDAAREAEQKAAERDAAERERKERLAELLGRGEDLIKKKDWDAARKVYMEARRLDPIDSRATRALSTIDREKRALSRYNKAEQAYAQKRYEDAIREHRLVPLDSIYRGDANVALKAIAGILEIQGDTACASKRMEVCEEKYSQALSTEMASEALEEKYARLLADRAKSKRRRRSR